MNLLIARILKMYVRQINLELEKLQAYMPADTIYIEGEKKKCKLFQGLIYILCDIIRLSDELRDGKYQEPEPARDDTDDSYTYAHNDRTPNGLVDWSAIPASGEYRSRG